MNRRLVDVTVGQLLVVLAVAALVVAGVLLARNERHWERAHDPNRVVQIR